MAEGAHPRLRLRVVWRAAGAEIRVAHPGEVVPIPIGARRALGRVTDADVVIVKTGTPDLIGGKRSYILERGEDGRCFVQHPGHIGMSRVGSQALRWRPGRAELHPGERWMVQDVKGRDVVELVLEMDEGEGP